MKKGITAFAAGLLFAVGLALSGMTRPENVLGFLDVFGQWDPALAFVMMGAIGVHALAYRWVKRRSAPLFSSRFELPTQRTVDVRLLLGAAVFGVGWGLAGLCPGPGIVSLSNGALSSLVFVVAMAVGVLVAARSEAPSHELAPPAIPEADRQPSV